MCINFFSWNCIQNLDSIEVDGVRGLSLCLTTMCDHRALIPFFGKGARAFRIGKITVVLNKIGKKYNVLCMTFLLLDFKKQHGILTFPEKHCLKAKTAHSLW